MSEKPAHPSLTIAMLTALTLLLTGCAATTATSPQAAHSPGPAATSSSATPPTAVASPGDQPLPAARMICTQETQDNVAKILSIAHPAQPQSTWADSRYTCTYHVPGGTLRLSVQQSADAPTAQAYFAEQQKSAKTAQAVEGLANLGLPAYLTPDGKASFVKDNMTLLVDASGLPTPGVGEPTRTHVAYQIATAILGCWNG